MKPLLIHVHIFYPYLWTEIKKCLQNIDRFDYDLFITMVENYESIRFDILEAFPKAQIEIVENRGYDVGPFIDILNKVRLEDFSYVIKLHTKRNMRPGSRLKMYNMTAGRWRKYALHFLSSANNFRLCCQAFIDNEKLGMISNYHLIFNGDIEDDDPKAYSQALIYLHKLGFSDVPSTFVAGTMFMCKANLLSPLKKLNLTLNSFDIPDRNKPTTVAHALERLMGMLVVAQHYEIQDCVSSAFKQKIYESNVAFQIRKILRFFFNHTINSRGQEIIRICRIPISVDVFHKDK